MRCLPSVVSRILLLQRHRLECQLDNCHHIVNQAAVASGAVPAEYMGPEEMRHIPDRRFPLLCSACESRVPLLRIRRQRAWHWHSAKSSARSLLDVGSPTREYPTEAFDCFAAIYRRCTVPIATERHEQPVESVSKDLSGTPSKVGGVYHAGCNESALQSHIPGS